MIRIIASLLVSVCIIYSAITGFDAYKQSRLENEYRYDYAEINMIKYGLFNLDLWKSRLFDVLKDRVTDFEITARDLAAIRKQIEYYLEDLYKEYFESGKLIDALVEAQSDDNEENKMGKLFVGLFRKNIEKEIKKIDFKSQIPVISRNLMVELERKTPEIKESISKSISDLLAKELASSLQDQRSPIYNKYESENLEQTNVLLLDKILSTQGVKKDLIKRSLSGLLLGLLFIAVFYRQLDLKLAMTLMTLICVVFLSLGLAMPMIDLDARLSSLDIGLMGANIHFDEQVMYFQSKSIIDVTVTLLEGRGIDLKIVGLLILLFSIVLPFLKMLFTLIYLYIEKSRKSGLIKTLIFYMGKWSMADVFVVAIFMSYIGFYGLLNSMLGDFSRQSHSSVAETINYSKLSPGIIFFTSYCVLSIIMSSIIHRKVLNKTEVKSHV